jgi:hypothetical protein
MSLHGVAHISVRAMKVKNIGMISSDEKTWSGQRRILIVKKFDANGQEFIKIHNTKINRI